MATNQGASSNETAWDKTNTQLPGIENKEGNESGASMTAGYGATPTQSGTPFMAPDNELNITASEENRSAQFKYPRKSQDVGEFGNNQYK